MSKKKAQEVEMEVIEAPEPTNEAVDAEIVEAPQGNQATYFGVSARIPDAAPVLRLGEIELAEFVDDAGYVPPEGEIDPPAEGEPILMSADDKAQLTDKAIAESIAQAEMKAKVSGYYDGVQMVIDAMRHTGLKADYAALKRVLPIIEAVQRTTFNHWGVAVQEAPKG